MVAVKAHQADAFLTKPDPNLSCFLFYGPDAGLVSERSRKLADALAKREDPPGEILRLDDHDLEDAPDRISLELRTMPMFGGRNIIRATAGRRISAATLSDLIGADDLAGLLIVEAGNLKPTDKMRKTFEAGKTAAAVACFPDDVRDLDRVIEAVLGDAGLTIGMDARQALSARLGADRAQSRGEIEKLALYAHGAGTVTVDHVEQIVGDASVTAQDRVVMATASGRADVAVNELQRAAAAGENVQAMIAAIGRHFHRLHRVRAAIDQGSPVEAALKQLRPPLHFKQRDAFTRQCQAWRMARLTHAVTLVGQAAAAARGATDLETVLAERLILSLARLSR